VRVDSIFYSCHVLTPSSSALAAELPFKLLEICGGNHLVSIQATLAPGGHVLLVVSHVNLLLHQLAAASKAETLFGTRMGLHLRHELSF
jgi:hypothetical protein